MMIIIVVIVIIVIITAGAGTRVGTLVLDSIADGGLGEVLRHTLVAVGIHRVQRGAEVGQQGGKMLAAVSVKLTVGTVSSLRISQLHGVGQLHGSKVAHGDVDLPHEALVGLAVLAVGVIAKDKVIIIAAAKAIDAGHIVVIKLRINQFRLIQLYTTHGQGQSVNVIDKVEIIGVSVIVCAIADHVHDLGAGREQIVDVVLDIVEVDCLSTGQIVHERGGPGIIGVGGGLHGVAVIASRGSSLIGLVGLIQGLVDGVGISSLPVVILRRGGHNGSAVGILIQGALSLDHRTDLAEPCRPVVGSAVGAVLRVPVIGTGPVVPSVGEEGPGSGRGFFVVHVSDAVADEDQILAVGVHIGVLIQHGLAGQEARMGIGAAGDFGFDGGLDSIHVLSAQTGQRQDVVGDLVENYDAHVDGGAGVFSLSAQVAEHGNHLLLHVGAGRLIQHKHHIGFQGFLGRGQGQRHLRFIVGIQIGGRLGLGNLPIGQIGITGVQRSRAVGSFQGQRAIDGADVGELHSVERLFMGLPAGVRAVVVPAVDGVVTVIQHPVGADSTKSNAGGSVAKNIVTSIIGVVIVQEDRRGDNYGTSITNTAASLCSMVVHNLSISRQCQHTGRTIINTSAVGCAFVIIIDSKDHTVFKGKLAVVFQTIMLVVEDTYLRTRLH